MAPEIRIKLSELALRYRLHPDLRDLFVEGPGDAKFFRSYAKGKLGHAVKVYPIEFVEVPTALLESARMTTGNRQRIIALCMWLESELGQKLDQARGLIDRDFDNVRGAPARGPSLLVTDFPSVETYCLAPRPFGKFLALVLGLHELDATVKIGEYAAPLRELFALRAAAIEAAAGIRWLPFENFIIRRGAALELSAADLLRASLGASGSQSQFAEISRRYQEISQRASLDPEPRNYVKGHDLVSLIWWDLAQQCRAAVQAKRVLATVLLACVEAADLSGHGLFSLLDRWLAQTA